MNRKVLRFSAALICAFLAMQAVSYASPAEDAVKKSQQMFLYAGPDMKARVLMRLVSKDGNVRIRELTMLRKNSGAAGEQRYYMFFHKPADVRGMTFMVWKYAGKDDDRWLFIPAVNMVRRIAASDRRSSFVGSDFSYEDVSGRDIGDDSHELVREERLSDRDCLLVKSAPIDSSGSGFSHRLSWIDKERWLPLKEEYYGDDNGLKRVFTADEVKEVSGHWTVMKRTMRNLETGHSTEVVFEKIEYSLGLVDGLFTERALKNPPKKLVE